MGSTEGAVLVAQQRPLELKELLLPELKPGQVMVEIAYSGVCHTQLNEWSGARGPDPYLPHTLGHEASGHVIAVGTGVTKVRTGQPVVLSWIKGQGADVPGTVYGSASGPVYSGAVSTFLRTAVISENRLTVIPDDMPMREAALLGCAVPTGCGIVWNTAKVKQNDSVAIIGIGGIGMCAILAAAASHAAPIIAVDIVPAKLAEGVRLGAHLAVNASETDALAAIRAMVKGGVDVAIEAAGARETMELAFEAVRPGGGLCVLAGNLPRDARISIDPYSLIAGKRIVGTWGGESNPDLDIPRYVKLFREGRLPLEKLSIREFPLSEINQAMQVLQSGQVVRSLVRMSGD